MTPLDGIRVIDVSQNLAGPFCTQTLADLGADVVKVEPVGTGDPARAWGHPVWDGEGTIFLAANRNKRSLAVNLKDDRGREVLERLVSTADVFVESFRLGVADALGFGAERLRAAHPRLVCCSITAYGAGGPLADQPGYDPLMQAHAGLMSVTGRPGDPVRVGTSVVDMGAGIWAALGVVAALRERDRTGRGAHVVSSLFETALVWNAYHLMGYWATGQVPAPAGTSFPLIAPYGVFPTADGRLMIAAANDALFQALCGALALPEVAADPRYRDNPSRLAHREALEARVAGATAQHPTAALRDTLRGAGVPSAPILDMAEVAAEPQTAACGVVDEAAHPRVPGYRSLRVPLAWDGVRTATRRAPPRAGEHSREILAQAGFDAAAIERLLADGIVGEQAER